MALIEDLILRFQALGTRETAAEVGSVDTAVQKTSKSSKEAAKSHSALAGSLSSLKSMAISTAGAAGLGGLVFGLGEAVKNAESLQATQAQLGQTIRTNVHHPARDATKQVSDFADRLATAGGFAPTQTLQSMQQLLRATGDITKLEQDMTVATNMARATHTDLARDVKAVSLVEQGRTTGLARLGIVLPKVTTAENALKTAHTKATAEQVARAKSLDQLATKQEDMRVLTQKFAGATTTYSNTAAGATSNLRNSVEVLSTRLGMLLLPIVTTVAGALSKFVQGMLDGKGAGGAFADVLKVLYDILKATYDVLKPLWPVIVGITVAWGAYEAVTSIVAVTTGILQTELMGNVLAFLALIPEIGSAADAMALFGIAMDAIPIVGWIAAIGAAIGVLVMLYLRVKWFHDAVNDVFNWIKGHWPILVFIFASPLLPLALLIQHFGAVKAAATDAVNWIIREFGRVVNFFKGIPSAITGAFQSAFTFIIKGVQWLVNWIPNEISKIAGGIASLPGKALSAVKSIPGVGAVLGALQGGGPVTQTGPYLVGERGPELVTLNRGSYVTPNAQAAGAAGGGEHTIVIYNILDGQKLSKSVIRQGLLQQSRGG